MAISHSIAQRALGELRLSTGRSCTLSAPPVPGLSGYFVVALPGLARSPEEAAEFQLLAHDVARNLAIEIFGDPECYSLMYSAGRTRRRPWPHVHIVIANSVSQRRRAVTLLQLKQLLRWREWGAEFSARLRRKSCDTLSSPRWAQRLPTLSFLRSP